MPRNRDKAIGKNRTLNVINPLYENHCHCPARLARRFAAGTTERVDRELRIWIVWPPKVWSSISILRMHPVLMARSVPGKPDAIPLLKARISFKCFRQAGLPVLRFGMYVSKVKHGCPRLGCLDRTDEEIDLCSGVETFLEGVDPDFPALLWVKSDQLLPPWVIDPELFESYAGLPNNQNENDKMTTPWPDPPEGDFGTYLLLGSDCAIRTPPLSRHLMNNLG